MKKGIMRVMALGCAAAVALSGCGGGSGSKQAEGGKVKLRFASWDSAEDLDSQQKLVDQFNASQDKIEVALEAYGQDYDTKISAGMGSGDTPDILYMWDYPAYYGGLEPLDAYIEKEGADFKADYYETLWSYNSMDGSIYGMPVGFTTHALYYNKDMFDTAGVEYPTADWTWDDLREASAVITEKCEGSKGFSFQIKADPYDYEMYLWSNGSSLVDDEGKLQGCLNSDKSVEVFNFFQGMEKDGIAMPTEKNGTDEMKNGKTAMFIYGSWALDSFKEAGLNYGVVEIPAFAGAAQDSVSILSSSGVSISKDSKHKDEAWEFIKFWTGEEMNKARIGYELPVLNSVVASEKLMEDEYKAPFYRMLEQSAGYTPACFKTERWSELREGLELALERIYNPSTMEDPKTVLDEAAGDQ